MSLDISLTRMVPEELYSANITHNVMPMAKAAGIEVLWDPQRLKKIYSARGLIAPLSIGIQRMRNNKEHFKQLEAENGWGTYDEFLSWLENLLAACVDYPDAEIEVYK